MSPTAVMLGLPGLLPTPGSDGSSSGGGGGGSSFSTLLLPVLLIGLVYFAFIRPQRARAKRASETTQQLVAGVQVMTTAGLYGTVAAIEDDAVLIEVAPGVTTRWAKAAIARVVTPHEAIGLPEDGAEPEDGRSGGSASDGEGPDDTGPGTDPAR